MALAKRTYTLPPDVLEPFEQTVSAGKRSSVIAELLREWIAEREEVKEWVEDMDEIHLEIENEFRPLDQELWRAIDDFELAEEPSNAGKKKARTIEEGRGEQRHSDPAR